jgi:hypothetical protein
VRLGWHCFRVPRAVASTVEELAKLAELPAERAHRRGCITPRMDTAAASLPVLWQLELSHYNEKVRWALDYKRVPSPTPDRRTCSSAPAA